MSATAEAAIAASPGKDRDRTTSSSAAVRSLRIGLASEGTYPYHMGGVSVWCDQLIRGLGEHRFTVVALTVDGTERTTWQPPANLDRVVAIPLWGRRPRRRRSRPPAWFGEVHSAFLTALIRPAAVRTRWSRTNLASFLAALRGIFEYAQTADLTEALLCDESLTRVMDAWHAAGLDAAVVSAA
jgi:hypothetical protein